MKRKIVLALLGLSVILVIIAAGVFWYFSGRPFYHPGMVSRQENLSGRLSPPAQPDGSVSWLVEPGIELAHFEEGSGINVLVVHGGPGMPFSSPLAGLSPLTGAYRFHYYDQRGCGESTRPIEQFASSNTYENMRTLERALGLGAQIADIERIRQLLGEEQLILIGHSWGGFLASLYAAEFPERVEALILVAPANVLLMPQPEGESDLFSTVRARLPADRQAEFDAFMQDYMDFNGLFAKSEADLVRMNIDFGRYYAEAMTVPAQGQGQPGGWMVWAQYLSMGRRHDYRPALAEVQSPVLVLHGGDDLQSEGASRTYADAFPHAEFVIIERAGHFPFADQPEAFAHSVLSFLQSLR